MNKKIYMIEIQMRKVLPFAASFVAGMLVGANWASYAEAKTELGTGTSTSRTIRDAYNNLPFLDTLYLRPFTQPGAELAIWRYAKKQ